MISSTRRIFFMVPPRPLHPQTGFPAFFYNMLLPHDAPLCLPFLTKRLEKKLKSYLRESKSRIVFTKCLRAVIRCHWAGPLRLSFRMQATCALNTDSLPVFAYPGHFSSLPASRRNHDAVFFRTGLWPNSEARIIIIL